MSKRRLRRRHRPGNPAPTAPTAGESASLHGLDVASRDKRWDGWQPGTGAADSILAHGRTIAVDRCRDLALNNPWAIAAIRSVAANSIGGRGIVPRLSISRSVRRSKVSQRRWLRRISDAWSDWATATGCSFGGDQNFAGQQSSVLEALMASGEVLIRRYVVAGDQGPELRLRLLEPECLDSSNLSDDERDGIAYGRSGPNVGRPVGYRIFHRHPGDDWIGIRESLAEASELVAADEILHIYTPRRPGQRRGTPWLAPVATALRDLHKFADASLLKSQVAAMMVGVVRGIMGRGGAQPRPSDADIPIRPGSLRWVHGAEGVDFSRPPANDDLPQAMTMALRQVASGLGVSYESLTGDLSQVNFSSARMGWLEFGRHLTMWREQILIPLLLAPVWRWWMLTEGQPQFGDMSMVRVNWAPPRREMIDPSREVPALINAVHAGIMSLSDVIAESGRDPILVFESIAETQEILTELGVLLSPAAAMVTTPASVSDDR